jgi:tryptophanyl-tRNA synthetase
VNAFLDPIRARRAQYESQPNLAEEILVSGTRRLRVEARATMTLVREAMGLPALPM